jgi:hypothetical protein
MTRRKIHRANRGMGLYKQQKVWLADAMFNCSRRIELGGDGYYEKLDRDIDSFNRGTQRSHRACLRSISRAERLISEGPLSDPGRFPGTKDFRYSRS